MNGELIKTGMQTVLSPSQIVQVTAVIRKELTPIQKALQAGLTASQLVAEWSGTIAQLNCNVSLFDVANAENIPTLADVNRSFSNSTSVEIITEHLKSVLRYAGVELTDAQLAETALSILSSYWYLNLAELCIFFSQLKNGSRGQFVWGTKINNQAIMVALADFCKDRRREIEHKENIRIRQDTENGYSRSETLSKDIVLGTKGIKNAREEAMQSFEAFLKFFPHLPKKYDAKVLWRAWGGDNEALHKIYGEKIPAKDVAEMDIGMYLCNYNIAKGKELEK
ncbi:hypothetical protein K0G28_27700 [Bacteroides faecis]|uniref:Uncharacterized protein n=2 Tax=Bacteroides faecis TaxID=674529 RepID=A0A6N2WM47_9BACE|nr:hypothetical protein [Bacteroides faecis]